MKITSFLQISPVGIGSAYLHFKTSGYAAAFVMQINGPNFYRTYLQEEITISIKNGLVKNILFPENICH